MNRIIAVAVVAAALLVPTGASAAAPDGAGPWADTVVDFEQGLRKNGTPVLPERSNPTAALGEAERTNAVGTFFSLGFGGQITLGYDNNICNGSGADLDLELVETTNGREEAVPAGATHDDPGGLRTDFDNVGIGHIFQPRWHSAQLTERLPKCSSARQARLHGNVIEDCLTNQRPARPVQYGFVGKTAPPQA